MNPKLISAAEFKKLGPAGIPPEAKVTALANVSGMVKQYAAEVSPGADRQIKFLITTGSVDRDYHKVNPTGWDVANYMKNPVVLFAHDSHNPPIGKCVALKCDDKGIEAIAEFMTADMNPFADSIYRMLKGGFLKATSVGFRPLDYEPATEKDRQMGYDFNKQELLEFSVV